ncbi:hypothetical protein [Kyrpidia spormannii]|nr:hypothetical protein [Kyrpidia spormannii]
MLSYQLDEHIHILSDSSDGVKRQEAKHDPTPWPEYFLTIILEAYRRFKQRVGAAQEHKIGGGNRRGSKKWWTGLSRISRYRAWKNFARGVSRPTIIGVLRLHPLYREGPQRQVGGISWSQPSVKPT